jgi:hypothetical protein
MPSDNGNNLRIQPRQQFARRRLIATFHPRGDQVAQGRGRVAWACFQSLLRRASRSVTHIFHTGAVTCSQLWRMRDCMKKLALLRLIVAGLLATVASAHAQFPIRLGSAGQEYGKCAATDRDGNILIGMLFQNTIDFDFGTNTVTLGTPPGIDCALAKYTPGGQLLWARHITGAAGASANTVCTPHGVAVDAQNNVILVGYFGLSASATRAVADFGSASSTLLLTNTGGWDPFIAKFDASGGVLWARTFGSVTNSATDERAWDVAVDATGSIYVTGFFQGAFDLDDSATGSNVVTSAGEKDIFLVKYDANGNHSWGFALNDTGDAATSLKETSVALDGAGRVYLMGHFNATMDLDPGAGLSNLSSAGGSDLFLARYSSAGALERAVRIGGTQNETAPPGTMRVGPDGNLVFSGRFRGIVDLNPGAGVFSVTNNTVPAADDIFVASLDGDLNFRWGFAIASDGGLDGGHRVALDSRTNVYVTGWFSGTTDFDGGPGVFNLASVNTNGASDCFLAKYDRSGSFLWARAFGGATTNAADLSIPAGLAVDFADAAYLTGQYYGTNVTFYPYNPTGALPDSLGQNDGFLVKYSAEGQIVGHELRITRILRSTFAVTLEWTGAPNVQLQRAASLLSPIWEDVPGTLGQSTASEPTTNAAAVYRLVAQ